MTNRRSVQITKAKASALTPAQRRFNKLIEQIERARQRLAAWHENIPTFRASYARELEPLQEAIWEAQRTWTLALDASVGQRVFTRNERITAKAIICESIDQLLEYDDDAELKAIFDKHSEVGFDAEKHEELQALKSLGEAFGGLDLGDDEVHSEEELMRRMQEGVAAQLEDQEDDPWPHKPKSHRAAAAEQRRAADAERVTQSIRGVYRRLASALHPDREPDAEKRATKTALMQKVNQAYENRDLLTLLEAQVQLEQIDADRLSDVDPQRLKNYNQALAEQLQQLQFEVNHVEDMFGLEFFVDPDAQLDPLRLHEIIAARTKAFRRDLNQLKRDLQVLTDIATTKRWLERERRARRSVDPEAEFFF
jgi:DNA uptake protein ComE-like DNA-binding protein